jgi:hypothetical protein
MATHGKTHGSISVVRSCHMRPGPDQMFVDQQEASVCCPHNIVLICSAACTLARRCRLRQCTRSATRDQPTPSSSQPSLQRARMRAFTQAHPHRPVPLSFLFSFPLSNVDATSHSDTMLAFSHHRMALTCQVGDRTDTRRKTTAFLPARLKWCQPLTVIAREMELCWTRIVWR